MLRSQLEELARAFTGGNAGQMEKLYLQDIVLHSIYQQVVDELVLKGGTALHKLYNLDRFSEDLDLTAAKEVDLGSLLESAERHLKSFGALVEKVQREEDADFFKARLGIRGPLYAGSQLSLSFVRIEVNKRADVEKPIVKRYAPNFPDIPAFEILALTEEEILAEKIRALSTRTQARDLYDSYHLLKKGIEIDAKLVERKLSDYGLVYDPARLLERAGKMRKSWAGLGSLVYSRLPEFDHALEVLRGASRVPGKHKAGCAVARKT